MKAQSEKLLLFRCAELFGRFSFTSTFSHLADAFIQSGSTYNWGVHKAINLEEANKEEVPITPSLRHCSNKYMLASCCLKIDRAPAFQVGVGRSFHQPGTVNENVLESDFEPLCDGTTRRRSLADLRLLEGM